MEIQRYGKCNAQIKIDRENMIHRTHFSKKSHKKCDFFFNALSIFQLTQSTNKNKILKFLYDLLIHTANSALKKQQKTKKTRENYD